MSDTPETDSMAAFNDKLNDLSESLDLLYIRNNASGRNKFRGKWPDVAQYLFGAQLIQYDNEGIVDRARRAQLENEAGERRIQIKITLVEMIEKSVDNGALQFEYIGGIIDQYGLDVARHFYTNTVIKRVRPDLLPQDTTEKDTDEEDAATS